MSNLRQQQKPPKVKRRAYVTCAVAALATISMTWYSHSGDASKSPTGAGVSTPSASGAKKARAAPASSDSSRMVPVNRWTGKKFMVLDKPKLFRKFGYELYLTKDLSTSVKHIDTSFEVDKHHLRYDKCCGTLLTVVAVEKVADEWLVSFSQNRTNLSMFGKTHKGAIEGIACIDDLDKAAAQWTGRVVYSRRRFIDTYDSVVGTFGTVKVNIQDRLTVTGVRWGTTPLPPKPVWLCVSTNEKETGIVPICQTWTNVMLDKVNADGNPWDEDLFEKNPMEIYSWDSSIWKAINSHTIVSGMSKEQVRVSWGQPQRVTTDAAKQLCDEQWLYGSQFLCLDHDTVTSVGGR